MCFRFNFYLSTESLCLSNDGYWLRGFVLG